MLIEFLFPKIGKSLRSLVDSVLAALTWGHGSNPQVISLQRNKMKENYFFGDFFSAEKERESH